MVGAKVVAVVAVVIILLVVAAVIIIILLLVVVVIKILLLLLVVAAEVVGSHQRLVPVMQQHTAVYCGLRVTAANVSSDRTLTHADTLKFSCQRRLMRFKI